MRMYHPSLGVEKDFPDDAACIATLVEVGWLRAPDPEPAQPGVVADPVRYEPVAGQADKAGRRRGTKPEADVKESDG